MFEPMRKTIRGVIGYTWPMILISVVIMVSFRLVYLYKNKEKCILYKELLSLSFIIYTLCLFQVVTFQYDVAWSTNNFIPFKEILRYNMGSHLFFKNVIGNMVLFCPFGFFVSYYLKNIKPHFTILLTFIASVAIEFVQLVIGRVFDIDDIILNLCGGVFGYLIYYFLYKLWDKIPKIFKSESFLDLISVIVLIMIFILMLL